MSGLIEISRRKAEQNEAWTLEDHGALVDHLAKVTRLAQETHDRQAQDIRMGRLQRVYQQTNGCRGEGGWRVCGECNADNPDVEW